MLGPKEIRWKAPEFEYYHKDVSWYWLTIILSLLVVALAIWQRNFLFAVFAVIAEVLIIFWGRRRPQKIEFQLNDKGLAIGDKTFYPYGGFLGFAFGENEVIFQKKNRFSPYLKVSVEESKSGEIKKLLSRYLPEIEYEESLVDHIAKILRF
jgi:hypothetical protein